MSRRPQLAQRSMLRAYTRRTGGRPALWELMVDLVYSGLDDQEVDRLRKVLDVEIVRRREHALGAES